MKKRSTPDLVGEEHGPFTYTYLAIAAVPGMRLSDDTEGHLDFCSLPEWNAEVFLTEDWDTHCVHIDRSAALAYLMLTGFRGRKRFGRLSVYWHKLMVFLFGGEKVFRDRLERETIAARARRHENHKSPRCYLVYRAMGDLIQPVPLNAARRFGNIGFGIDAIQGVPYREQHRRALHSSATALSLALVDTNGSPHIHFFQDLIYLTGKDGFTLYSHTLEMGAATLIISSLSSAGCIDTAKSYIPRMINDNRIEIAISLFVESQNKKNDNLRSFIAAWSALELLINRLSKVARAEWRSLLETRMSTLPPWDRNLVEVSSEEYRMRDRFFSVTCVLDLDSAQADSEAFIRINDVRSGFYHRMEVRDKDLPTNDVQTLFRKYLRLGLAHQYDKN
ncbi:MAG: hypothetical protein LWX51_16700 [Deltaproteobacteria bacterium]|jgi:hypothetical protein|nr:hypothetical protein [Deltaproteobacteria bacterium]